MCCCWQGDSEEICSQANLSWAQLMRLKPITVLSDPRWHNGLSLSILLFVYICIFPLVCLASRGRFSLLSFFSLHVPICLFLHLLSLLALSSLSVASLSLSLCTGKLAGQHWLITLFAGYIPQLVCFECLFHVTSTDLHKTLKATLSWMCRVHSLIGKKDWVHRIQKVKLSNACHGHVSKCTIGLFSCS